MLLKHLIIWGKNSKIFQGGEKSELYQFLIKVDRLFPIPLSNKESLAILSSKLEQFGTIASIREHGKIVAICAGYTNDSKNKLGYISVVASVPECSSKGYGNMVVQKFIEKAKKDGMMAIHLYADSENRVALRMYKKLGFVDWYIDDEPRPKDKHLIKGL